MTVFDCFTFFNELDLLDLRLHEMSPYVDVFVLVESPVTFRGEPKPLHYARNRDRFARFHDRIRHVVVDDMPAGDAWTREWHQRNAIRRGLADAPDDATVIVSDVDEILREDAVHAAADRAAFVFFTQELFYLYANWRATLPQARLWTMAYAAPWSTLRAMPDLNEPRERQSAAALAARGLDPARHVIDRAGWHFSWTGGVDRLVTKLGAFSHSEPAMQQWNDPAVLAQAIGDGRFFYTGERLENLAIGPGFPAHLRREEARYRELGLVSPDSGSGLPYYETPRTVLMAELDAVRARLGQVEAELAAMRASTSWRLTAPVRAVVEKARGSAPGPRQGRSPLEPVT